MKKKKKTLNYTKAFNQHLINIATFPPSAVKSLSWLPD